MWVGLLVLRTRIRGRVLGGVFALRTRIRGCILGAVPPSLRSYGPLRAAGRPCRASAGPDLARWSKRALVPSRRRGKGDRPPAAGAACCTS